jgi:hypothetical protein
MACWNTKIETLNNGKLYINSGNRSNSYFGKFWVAKITGTDPKFGLSRQFVNDKDGAVLEDGIYQIYRNCQWAKRAEEYFLKVIGNTYETLTKQEVISLF